MDFAVGAIFEGKVTGITKFGAFVSLPEGKSGMVHISEVANSFVNDIKDFLTEGQDVKVKVINIDDVGRINLSIKKAQENTEQTQRQFEAKRPRPQQQRAAQPKDQSAMTFEDKLKMFMADSESRMADIKHNNDRKSGARRRR
ncbi:MAG TPA: S1 RNA-binding domain-containing protein [Candidatus Butyricicoccus avistercoris]|uniref:S1 RNA-binding domain-containing protein n=1 Tax=Candidatus Butyricicoccus avistercoris TaxID=2838518 RepID=A0A9D1PIL8_9FIRM|nr:S1 RNA-binding domain-containing protein [Candidatus Butyricicoccus avistercoris]